VVVVELSDTVVDGSVESGVVVAVVDGGSVVGEVVVDWHGTVSVVGGSEVVELDVVVSHSAAAAAARAARAARRAARTSRWVRGASWVTAALGAGAGGSIAAARHAAIGVSAVITPIVRRRLTGRQPRASALRADRRIPRASRAPASRCR
jgi:hypothetical protein